MLGGIDVNLVWLLQNFTSQWIDPGNFLDLIPKKADPYGFALTIGGQNFERVTPHPEDAGFGFQVIALILNVDQLPQEGIAAINLSLGDV